ncbi:MAG: radical SAM protein, partial [Patescibacteria group bacterium]
TCVVRQTAEDRVYGLVRNLAKLKPRPKIVVTGCLVGTAVRNKSGRKIKQLRELLPLVDEFLPIEEVGFEHQALRQGNNHAWLPISNGCNNMCAYCIVPLARGREISRPFADIIQEAESLAAQGYQEITLLGQNVNSYGADLLQPSVISKETKRSEKSILDSSSSLASLSLRRSGQTPRDDKNKFEYQLPDGKEVKPVMVKSMGRMRVPSLFPYLLERVAQIKKQPANGSAVRRAFGKVSFLSSNPWDFSDELVAVIANYKNINREIHLPVQSGDDKILKAMNRWYTREQYLDLITKIQIQAPDASFTTDIIVGFPGETKEQFQNTVKLCRQVNFNVAYIACYSPRPGTAAAAMEDNVPRAEKKRRFHVLDKLVNRSKCKYNPN